MISPKFDVGDLVVLNSLSTPHRNGIYEVEHVYSTNDIDKPFTYGLGVTGKNGNDRWFESALKPVKPLNTPRRSTHGIVLKPGNLYMFSHNSTSNHAVDTFKKIDPINSYYVATNSGKWDNVRNLTSDEWEEIGCPVSRLAREALDIVAKYHSTRTINMQAMSNTYQDIWELGERINESRQCNE